MKGFHVVLAAENPGGSIAIYSEPLMQKPASMFGGEHAMSHMDWPNVPVSPAYRLLR